MSSPLVNAHTHLEQGWQAELCPRPPGRPFTDWIADLVLRSRQHRPAAEKERLIRAGIATGIQTLLDAGTTHVGDISSTGLSVEPLLHSRLAGVVYLEVLGLDEAAWRGRLEWAIGLLDKYRPQERHGLRLGLSAHAPYSTHPDAFRAVADYCRREELPLCIHLAESPAERQLLLHGDGPLPALNARLGAPPPPSPGLSPVAYLDSLGVLEARPLLVHMVQVSDDDLDRVAASRASVAHCPRSNSRLQCGRMPLEKMLARAIPVALGTDSLGSSPSLDVRQEAVAAVALHQGMVPAATIHALLGSAAVLP